MQKFTLIAACILGVLSVGIGAFGAHGLKTILEATGRTDTFETAVKYQFYHTLAILLVGILMSKIEHQLLNYVVYSFLAGILLFSGSLYILSLSGVGRWGALTPLGGLFFIIGWILLLFAIARSHI
ncbi:MAG: DUF423 domain-containing protein [Candidatus Cyclobacteriaceae bacterium M3_2C_046]